MLSSFSAEQLAPPLDTAVLSVDGGSATPVTGKRSSSLPRTGRLVMLDDSGSVPKSRSPEMGASRVQSLGAIIPVNESPDSSSRFVCSPERKLALRHRQPCRQSHRRKGTTNLCPWWPGLDLCRGKLAGLPTCVGWPSRLQIEILNVIVDRWRRHRASACYIVAHQGGSRL